MPITDRQREQRRRHIGASDVPAILGRSPWRTPYEVWLDKTGRLAPEESSSEAAELGNMIEPGLLAWGAATLGVAIRRNQRRVKGCMAANLDALAVDRPLALEAKTSGIISLNTGRGEWGEPGTDQVPEHVALQCLAQMWVADLDCVAVPALIAGRGRLLYLIERTDLIAEAAAEIAARCHDWWDRYVIGDHAPPATPPPAMDVLSRVRRQPGKSVPVPVELVARVAATRATAAAAAKEHEEAKAALLVALGDAEAGEVEGWRVSYAERNRAGYTVEPKTYRQLDVRPIKEPKQ
jgi:putative phage-type endonuclease